MPHSSNLPQPVNPPPPNLPQPAANGSPEQVPPLDPEQLRQFQEFQRFQEYLRFTQAQQGTEPAPTPDGGLVPAGSRQPQPLAGGQPPAPPNQPGALAPYEDRPRKPVPRWVKRLGGKILGWVLVLVLLYLGGNWLYHKIFPSDDGKTSEQVAAEGGGKLNTNQLLPTSSPYEAVRGVYDGIAQHGPGIKDMVAHVCGRFDEATQVKFAKDTGFADCPAAVAGIHQILEQRPRAVNDYAESIPKQSTWPPGPSVVVKSCDFAISGGPPLGTFTVSQLPSGQWLITGHSGGLNACPSAPPTTSGTP
ncbi:hypothetical protein [Amycolatopsis jejuensis]|uniref:hypothetical protein n=1 Tax=Amycolatopsis jejuensis TaxID=330084 RepID=UPI0005257D02|nr:hypothetical protein [Amycolatopsis jejuensis]